MNLTKILPGWIIICDKVSNFEGREKERDHCHREVALQSQLRTDHEEGKGVKEARRHSESGGEHGPFLLRVEILLFEDNISRIFEN